MNEIEPVFPVEQQNSRFINLQHYGLQVRDLFALVALHGLLAGSSELGDYEIASIHAYQYADKMLAERGKSNG